MNLIIAGDLVPSKSNINLFEEGNAKELLGEDLLKIWNNNSFKIANLEVPITDNINPIKKNGPNLIAGKKCLKGIKELNISILGLANNHILDQGESGLVDTIRLLDENKIAHVGAGMNLKEASKYKIIEVENKKVGIYACAENEFSIATERTPGANPFDPLESLDHVKELKGKCDYVIVLYHGGKEHYRYPSPNLQKVCRKIVEKGADIVVCQHSHCIGAYEEYNNSHIIYGQGNFIFDGSDSECWNTSLLIDLDINENKIKFIPIKRIGNKVRLAQGNEKKYILEEFNKRTEEIKSRDFIEKKYKEFSNENLKYYLNNISPYGKLILRIDKYIFKGKIINKLYNDTKKLSIVNYINCEAHRELLLKGLEME